jgi:hypothetical protein
MKDFKVANFVVLYSTLELVHSVITKFSLLIENKLLPISYLENFNASPYDPNFSGLNYSGHNFFVFISFRLFVVLSVHFFWLVFFKKSVPASFILALSFSAHN